MAPDRDPPTDQSNRREHYRVQYPLVDRPAFAAGVIKGLVLDCSETGARVSVQPMPADVTIKVGDRMAASIRFMRGELTEVAGEVVRWDGTVMILHFDREKIPFGKILREQWWLRQRYPWRTDE